MTTVGIMSAGAMGSAVGAAYLAGGARVVTTVAGRSPRTARLAQQAGLELLDDVAAVVAAGDLHGAVGLPPELFAGVAAAYAGLSWPGSPEDVPADLGWDAVLDGLR